MRCCDPPGGPPLPSDARGRRPGLYPTVAFRGGRPVGRPPDRCVCVRPSCASGPTDPTDRDRTVPIRQLFVSPELGFFSRSVGSPGGTGEGWVGGLPDPSPPPWGVVLTGPFGSSRRRDFSLLKNALYLPFSTPILGSLGISPEVPPTPLGGGYRPDPLWGGV